jgi:hypothetical protein
VRDKVRISKIDEIDLFLQFLVSEGLNFRGQCFLYSLMTQIEAIKFMKDWNEMDKEPGGKKYKSSFANNIYHTRTGCTVQKSDTAS